MAEVTEPLRLAAGLVMLAGASVSDLRTRRVRNHFWFPFVAVAAVFVLGDVAAALRDDAPARLLWPYGGALALTAAWYAIWWLGLFGGADAKGLMVLSWLLPFPLDAAFPVPPALDAIVNGSLLVLAYPLGFLAVNVVRGRIRLPAAFLGTPMPLDVAQRRKVWPMQRVADGDLRWRYWQRIGGSLEETYRELRQAGVEQVWTTPKVPFMVPIGIGLWIAWQHGNLVLRAVAAATG